MRRYLALLALIILIVAGAARDNLMAAGLSVKAGIGYDFLSQEFFADSLDQSQADSLEILTDLRTTYLNDFKEQVTLEYVSRDLRSFEVQGTLEHAPDQVRFRLNSDYRPRFGSVRLDWTTEIDWREGYGEESDPAESYWRGYSRAKAVLPVLPSLSLWARVKADLVRFEDITEYSYNHTRYEGKLGVTQEVGGNTLVDMDLFYAVRRVPDSSRLDYRSIGGEVLGSGFYGGGEFDAYLRVEAKDYNAEGKEDDYLRLEGDIRSRFDLNELFFCGPEMTFEMLYFDDSDILNNDSKRLEGAVLGGLESRGWAVGLGPHFGLLTGQSGDPVVSEEYFEYGLKTAVDCIGSGRFFGSAEAVGGYRNLETEGELQSDFYFWRLDALADWSIWRGLSFNLLFSAEWEWHEQALEDNAVFLISSALYYSF